MKVLIVDDDAKSRKVLRDLLAMKEIEVVEAATGREAVRLASPEFHFFICDIKLPDIDGYEVARQVKAKCPQLPIIAHTASALKEERNKLVETKLFEGVLLKPIQMGDYNGIIERWMK